MKSGGDFLETEPEPETQETIQETEQISVPLDKQIEETEPLKLEPVDDQEPATEEIEIQLDDCEMLYGVVMETAHSIVGTRKDGITHRELPDERRKAQGKILYNICTKYNIKIPTEFELVIFGGAMIADWQYMTVKEKEDTGGKPKNEIPVP
jgi:hypothetical protein